LFEKKKQKTFPAALCGPGGSITQQRGAGHINNIWRRSKKMRIISIKPRGPGRIIWRRDQLLIEFNHQLILRVHPKACISTCARYEYYAQSFLPEKLDDAL
jgi:hypothetical protein